MSWLDENDWMPTGTTEYYNPGYDSAADADFAAGLIPQENLAELLGKDNITYTDWMKEAMTPEANTAIQKMIADGASGSMISKVLNAFKTNGSYDWGKIGMGALGLYNALNKGNQTGGYSRPVPKMEVVRQAVEYDDANRVPGSAGRQYFTTPLYVAQGDTAAKDAALAAAAREAQGLRAAAPAAAPQTNPYAGTFKMGWANPAPAPTAAPVSVDAPAGIAQIDPTTGGLKMAHGGIAALARGGRYLAGDTDGMADEINTSIDDHTPAKLSHGEFVIPADVVSHLGNGNSDAGAKKLYDMMAKVRKARTGTTKQGKQIDAEKYTGGLAAAKTAYADGGAVTGMSTATGAGGVPLDTSRTSSLSPWAGDYVTNMLGQGAALANQPYQAYTGPLTAGPADLQSQAFAGISDIAKTGYTPGAFSTGTFGAPQAQQYMNPYLQASLDPQLKELKRQADIARLDDASRLTKAGAFGGSRQAIMESEGRRNLLDKQMALLGTGYNTAFNKAMEQFNLEQGRQFDVQKANEAARQFSADYGLKTISDLAQLGAQQRDITQQGLSADKAAYEQQQEYPFKMVEFQRKLLEGLPIGTTTTAVNQDALSALQSNAAGLASLYKSLAALGQTPNP